MNANAIMDPFLTKQHDEISALKIENTKLKAELKRLLIFQSNDSPFIDLLAKKETQIELLQKELATVKKERDELRIKLESAKEYVPRYEPVANPLQTALINYLMSVDVLRTNEVEDVMRSIDRGDFAPKDAYIDSPQMIGFNTTISAPHMHALQLELLKDCLKGAKKALDIGTGSGYMTLALAKMMKGKDIKVYGIDHIPKLIDQARENLTKHHSEYLDTKIELIVADGREGLEQHAPFDIILVGGAMSKLPEEFLDQLAPGGSMLIPVGEHMQKLLVVHRTKDGNILKTPVMSVGFGRLQSVEDQCPDIDE